MPSRKTCATDRGSLMLELCIALAILSFTLSAVALSASSLKSSVDSAINSRIKFLKSYSELEDIIYDSSEDFSSHDENSTYINPCLKKVSSGNFFVTLFSKTIAGYLGGDCDGNQISPTIDSVKSKTYNASAIILDKKPNALDTIQDYIFIATDGPDNQLNIYSDKGEIKQESQTSLPGITGSYPNATSIFYYDRKIYIGTHRTAGREFQIFDVKDPANPIFLGSREINHNINAISISVDKKYTYLATSGNTRDLIILDISNPSNILQSSTLNLPGSEDSVSAYLFGKKLQVGKKKSATEIIYYSVDISDPINPKIL